MHPGYIGAIAGSAIGILGGIFGTWCSIAGTRGPCERALMIKAAVGAWIGVAAFLAGMLLIAPPYKHLLWVPYAILLPLSIRWLNRRQVQIRQQESSHRE
jgi:membrane protein implicated in regulation of membrane protease activity